MGAKMILCNTMEKFMAEFVVEMNTLGVEKVEAAMRRVLDVTQKINNQTLATQLQIARGRLKAARGWL